MRSPQIVSQVIPPAQSIRTRDALAYAIRAVELGSAFRPLHEHKPAN